jgi:hypothetical protein
MSPLVTSVLFTLTVSVGGMTPDIDSPRAQESGSTPAAASAQTGAAEIRGRLKDGQKIFIVDDQGREWKGRVVGLGADGLTLLVGSHRTDVQYSRIVRIDRPRDGVWDGALIGLGIGAGLGLLGALAAASDDGGWASPDPGDVARIAPLVLGGIGAGIGLGLDAAIRRETNLYQRHEAARISLFPVLGRSSGGLAVSLSW